MKTQAPPPCPRVLPSARGSEGCQEFAKPPPSLVLLPWASTPHTLDLRFLMAQMVRVWHAGCREKDRVVP